MKVSFLHTPPFVLLISFLLSLGLYLWILITTPSGILQTVKLQQFFALIAFAYLYLALLASPFCHTFSFFPYRKCFLDARNSFIISAFYFGVLHGCISFFGQLGGFSGLGFLSANYLLAITLSASALCILFLVTLYILSFLIKKIEKQKSLLIKILLYCAGVLTLLHALFLGTHFQTLSSSIPQIVFYALVLLLFLELRRFDTFLLKRYKKMPQFGIATTCIVSITMLFFLFSFLPTDSVQSLNIHSAHIQLANDAQQLSAPPTTAKIPGLRGDRTKRFNVTFVAPENSQPNQDTQITFKITDASSGNSVQIFEKVYEKPMHLIIVDNSLTYYNHIHPIQTADGFTITTQFPKSGTYHLYIDFQPFGAIEQQFAFTQTVGNGENTSAKQTPDRTMKKLVDAYEITMQKPDPLVAQELSIGKQEIAFTVQDAKTKNPIKTLKPYLGAFGHLVMINQKTYEYIHVHPTNLTSPLPNENGGPTVSFMPLGLYGPIKPGIYRVFVQVNPNNHLLTADYTIEIQ